MKLYTFELWYKYKGGVYSRIYTKFCRYPKKTKLYKNLIYLLDNDSKVIRLDISQKNKNKLKFYPLFGGFFIALFYVIA